MNEFMASLLCEYALYSLQYNETDSEIYSPIKRFLIGELSSQRTINELAQTEEINRLISEFPDISAPFDYSVWQAFLESSSWEESNGFNVFTLNGHIYEIPQRILCLYQSDNGVYAQRYKADSEGVAHYQNIGDGEGKRPASPLFLEATTLDSLSITQPKSISVTDEGFFELSEIIKKADEDQRSAIRSGVKNNLVIIAGAGSGKTRTLVCRLAYLHLVVGIPLDKMLLLTFTTSAANEMRKRSLQLIEPIYDQYKQFEKPNINARTIDSFIVSIIDTYYAQIGFETKPTKYLDNSNEVKAEKIHMLEEIIADNKLQGIFKYYYDAKTGRPNSQFEWLLKNLMDYASGLPINAAGFDILLKLYQEKQRERGMVMGFTEASLFVRDSLNAPGSALKGILENRYSCILIDEFQDVSVLQNALFQPLYAGSIHFTFVGDDDQSIYYWRGSDNSIIQGFLKDPQTDVCYLLTNYRNNPNIVKAGNAVLSIIQNRAKASKPIKPYRTSGPKIRIARYNNKYTNLTAEVGRLIYEGESPEEICILSRSKDEANRITSSLSAANIPVARNSINVDANDNYLLMKAILCLLNNTNITESIKTVLRITNTEGVTERSVYKIITGQGSLYDIPDSLLNAKVLADEIRLSAVTGLANAVERYVIKAGELFEDSTDEKHSDRIFSYFYNFCINNNAPWPITQMQLKELFKSFEDNSKREGSRTIAAAGGVKVSTIHAAKGLEYNVVMITGLADGLYPSTSQIDKVYSARNAQLQTLKESKGAYQALKNSIHEIDYLNMREACVNPSFSAQEADSLGNLQDELSSMKGSILSLSADGVEEYLDAYRYYVLPLESHYKNSINEQERLILVDRTYYESARDQLYLAMEASDPDVDVLKQDLNLAETRINDTQKRINRINMRARAFSNCIAPLKAFYNACITASGLLFDIERVEELEELKESLEKEREQRINEERRLFYVAITRARDFLYLCYSEDSEPSDFINIIDDELKTSYIMMTVEEEDEYKRLSGLLHSEFSKPTINEETINETTDELLNQDSFRDYTKDKADQFVAERPSFSKLSGDVKEYFEKALRLLFIEDLVGGDFQTEFAHNIQRMSEALLSSYAGASAIPYKLSEDEMAKVHTITNDIRRIAGKCVTDKPSPSYIVKLITEHDKYNETLKKLKSSGIMHYVVRSGRYSVPESVLTTWTHASILADPDGFLVAVLDLANIRNALIHDKMKDDWPEDSRPMILKNAELLVNACGF